MCQVLPQTLGCQITSPFTLPLTPRGIVAMVILLLRRSDMVHMVQPEYESIEGKSIILKLRELITPIQVMDESRCTNSRGYPQCYSETYRYRDIYSVLQTN